ncbi:hypothetical protein AX17_004517 [Amanita inopinata Kibby_2008]|nr:hypothetical protein AX17_004517 [Amanita inopinata Kibby_2008]
MILRQPALDWLPPLLTSLLVLCPQVVFADDKPFDCHVEAHGFKFDLTSLAGEQVLNRTRDTPPSRMVDSLRFNMCAELKSLEAIAERDQCPSGTRTCLTTINQKEGSEERIVSVIPVTQTSTLDPSYVVNSSPRSLVITFAGPEYPHPVNSTLVQQHMDVTLICDPEGTTSPKFVSYDGARVALEWTTQSGCPLQNEGNEPEEDDDKKGNNDGDYQDNVGSGVGWFFLVLLLAFIAYFTLGAYYNYSTYGARGADLIPYVFPYCLVNRKHPNLQLLDRQTSGFLAGGTLHVA